MVFNTIVFVSLAFIPDLIIELKFYRDSQIDTLKS